MKGRDFASLRSATAAERPDRQPPFLPRRLTTDAVADREASGREKPPFCVEAHVADQAVVRQPRDFLIIGGSPEPEGSIPTTSRQQRPERTEGRAVDPLVVRDRNHATALQVDD